MKHGDKIEADNLYFTSDLHLMHKNIIKYVNRPFSSIIEMEEVLINNWNRVVPKDGTVFLLGDFIFTGNISIIESYIKRLNGNIHLILGNHDYKNKLNRDSVKALFASVHDLLYINVIDDEMPDGKQGLFLSHYPMLTWASSQQGSWNLFGHIHSGIYSTSSDKTLPLKPTQYDVGVDNNQFSPVSYQYIKEQLTRGVTDIPYTFSYYMSQVNLQIQAYPAQRKGQIYFNVFHSFFPKEANEIRNTYLDPYYNLKEGSLQLFFNYIHKYFKNDNI